MRCRWPAFRCWRRSPVPSITTISRSSAGRIATLGIWQLVATDRGGWLALALAGVMVAAWAKATGLVLTAAMVSAVIVYLIWRRRWRWPWTIAVAVRVPGGRGAVCRALRCNMAARRQTRRRRLRCSKTSARASAWTSCRAKSFLAYLGYFVVAFIAEMDAGAQPARHFQLRHAGHSGGGADLCFGGTAVVAAASVVSGRKRRWTLSWSRAHWRSR